MVAFLKELKKKFNPIKFLLIVFSIIFIFLLILNIRIIWQRELVKKELDSLKEESSNLEIKENKFSEDFSKTDDKDYLERIARQNLNLQKEGESVVVFPMDSDNSTSSGKNLKTKKNLWQKFIGIFGIK